MLAPRGTFVLGMVAAVLTTGSWVPQLLKTWRSRNARDFSWSYLAMFSTGVGLWAVYGVVRTDPAVIAANVLTLLLVLWIAAIKLRE